MSSTLKLRPRIRNALSVRKWKRLVHFLCLLTCTSVFLTWISNAWFGAHLRDSYKSTQFFASRQSLNISSSKDGSNSSKLILYWTSFFKREDFHVGFGSRPFIGCPVKCCQTTNNRSLLHLSDAVVFHAGNLRLKDMPLYRLPHQRWVFFFVEPPIHTGPLHAYANVFNWTMSYRSDSDIHHPYGVVRPFSISSQSWDDATNGTNWTASLSLFRTLKNSDSEKVPDVTFDYDTFIKNKKKHVAWFVSDCVTTSGREKYVKALSQFIDIDIYGKCGNLSCENRTTCARMLGRDYKFYIAFENSICVDYVTEKFFNALQHGVVPIVFGIEAHTRIGPPNSFIDADSFESPETLAKYLHILIGNDTLYREYLQWIDDYKPTFWSGWCSFCQMLNDPKQGTSIYTDIHHWWFIEGNCDIRG